MRICDRIAYLNHDVEDAVRGGIFNEDDLPEQVLTVLGRTSRERVRTMITDILETSFGQDVVAMSPLVQETTDLMRRFLFENINLNPAANQKETTVNRMNLKLARY